MDTSLNEKVKQSIQNLRDKKSRIYFLVQDTKGNAKASVRLIYQMAKSLLDAGFNPIILHEKKEYAGVIAWLDEEYMSIPHRAIEGQNLEISPEDFIIVPEVFGYVMEQIKNLPCGKIVFTQNYNHIVETLQPGQNWAQYGFFKCLTTTKKQQEYIRRKLFSDIGDNYGYDFSMRNFYTNPNTTIPNDQGGFANFCFGDMISAKEGNSQALGRWFPRIGGVYN